MKFYWIGAKANQSPTWSRRKLLTSHHFQWQGEFGAFSHSHRNRCKVIQYMRNQQQHHAKQSFKDEFHSFLKHHELPHEEKQLFQWLME